jgi:hypothetical protein
MSGNQIIRTVKDRNHPYSIINNEFFSDRNLSAEARGTLGYLLTKPDNWQVQVNHLQWIMCMGRDQLRRVLRELEGAGYLMREAHHDPETGRWLWVSTVYETPSPENPSMVDAAADSPLTARASIKQVRSTASTEELNTEGEGALPLNEALPPYSPESALEVERRAVEVQARLGKLGRR